MSKSADPRMLDDETTSDPYGMSSGAEPAEPELRSCSEERKGQVEGQGQTDEKPCSSRASESNRAANATKMAGGHEAVHLPQTFLVKYLGQTDAAGLWGIKFTRKPVDALVSQAKAKPEVPLPLIKLEVTTEGIKTSTYKTKDTSLNQEFTIDSISYGVQDLVYTRVFAMIVVSESSNVFQHHPFRCFAFVCDARSTAKKLTISLAKAFQDFSQSLKKSAEVLGDNAGKPKVNPIKRFAIDLRSAEELQKDMATEEDSEA